MDVARYLQSPGRFGVEQEDDRAGVLFLLTTSSTGSFLELVHLLLFVDFNSAIGGGTHSRLSSTDNSGRRRTQDQLLTVLVSPNFNKYIRFPN